VSEVSKGDVVVWIVELISVLEETTNELLGMIVDDSTVSLEMIDDSEVRLTRLVANVDETTTEELSSTDVDTDEDSRVSKTDADTDDAGRTVELRTKVDDATDENSLAVVLGITEDV
jgi:hypothetical protein